MSDPLPTQPFNKDNIFIIPIDLYDSLINAAYNLIECLANLPYYYEYELSAKLGNVIKYCKINRDIQHTLIKIINKKGRSFTNIYVYTDRLKFYQDMRVDRRVKLETFNPKYICELGLGHHYPNINPNTIRDFYILNDFNYLNSSPYVFQNIKLNIIISLYEAKTELNEFNKSLTKENILPFEGGKNRDYVYKLYKKEYIPSEGAVFIKHYACEAGEAGEAKPFLINLMLVLLRIKLYNDRIRKNSNIITSAPCEALTLKKLEY